MINKSAALCRISWKLSSLMLGLCLTACTATAQTLEHRAGISVGGGPQDYSSSFGNGFKFSSPGWHGGGDMYVGAYINPSFDILFSGSIGDLGSSRVKSVGMYMKYKAANDRFLPEASKLKPYVYLGAAFNNLTDRVKPLLKVNYMSLNAGIGLRYYVTQRIHLSYNISFGDFLTNNADAKLNTNPREVYIHNALLLGIDVF